MSSYSGPLVDWWNMAHPGEPFPDPKLYPQMFSGYNLNIVTNEYEGDPSCSNGMLCQHGIFDYECQIQNSCYLNILQLVCVLFIIGTIIYIIVWLIAFCCRHRDKIKAILSPLVQLCCCINGTVKRMNCDFFRKRIAKNLRQKEEKRIKKIKAKMKKMGMQVNLQALPPEKRQQLQYVVDQYQIMDDDA